MVGFAALKKATEFEGGAPIQEGMRAITPPLPARTIPDVSPCAATVNLR